MENSAGDCRAVPPPPRGSANNQQPTKDPCDQYRRQRPHTSVPAPHNHLHIHTNVRTTTRIVVSLFRRRSLDHGCLSGDVETLFDTMDRATFVSVKISRIDRFNVTSYTTDSSIYGVDPNASRRLGPRSSVMNGTHYHLLPTTAGLRTPAAATSTTYDGRPGACRQPNLTLTRSPSTAGIPTSTSSPHIHSTKPAQHAGRQGPLWRGGRCCSDGNAPGPSPWRPPGSRRAGARSCVIARGRTGAVLPQRALESPGRA